MEIRGRITKKKKRKRRRRSLQQQEKLFPILLAAFCAKSRNARLINNCLNEVLLSLPRVRLSPFLSLLPALLKFNCTEIVHKSVEIIGAATLASFEMNEKVSMEDDIVKGLISISGSSKREIAMAACNAMLDLSTTSVGRHRLLEFSAIECLLLRIIQEYKVATVSLTDDLELIQEDECLNLLLHCVITLVNSCTVEQLQYIPTQLSEKFSVLLKLLWGAAHRQQLCGISSRCDQIFKFSISMNSLAESIFRLSFNHEQYPVPTDFENVMKSIFDLRGVSIEQFLLETWETSPVLITNVSEASMRQGTLFSPFIQYLGPKEEIPTFIPSMLKDAISCPAIASDDLDILQVISEMKNQLGCPIIYNQDIRVVKTQYGERESHYFQNLLGPNAKLTPQFFSVDDIMKCEEAFNQGYSIALRGMEFRFQSIAAIAEGLASLFGQPSAGVNMYLTPSNSQGLARHSDDHCVLVCQLIGVKRWTVFSRPNSQLPRLYEPLDGLLDSKEESQTMGECQHFLLKEGDILYIPRGFPHEARTDAAADENVSKHGFSLHLTLAIEIEPPFEWEGFMHVALFCWDKKESSQYKLSDSIPRNLHAIAVRLLHVAIRLIGKIDPGFRKACLVGATALTSYSTGISDNQIDIFKHLVSRIASESKFSDALQHMEAAGHRNEDPIEHIRWMTSLTEMEGSQSSNIASSDNSYVLDFLTQHSQIAEATFVQVKSKFCNEVKLQDVEQCYKVVLEKYRKVRKQYTNSMLSLHSALQHAN